MTLIDNCDVEKLIYAVQNRRPIYDNSAKEHGSRGLIEHLWNEIAEEMNAPVNKCKAKWQQLRNSFVRSYRGTSGYGKKRKKWYLHDALSFIEEHIQLHKLDDIVYNADERSMDEDYKIDEKIDTNNDISETSYHPPHPNFCLYSENPKNNNNHNIPAATAMYPNTSYFQHHNQHQIQEHSQHQQQQQQQEKVQNHATNSSPISLIEDDDVKISNDHHHEETNDNSENKNNKIQINHHNPHNMPLPPKLKQMPQQIQIIPSKYLINNEPQNLNLNSIESNCSIIPTNNNSCKKISPQDENPLLNFCKGILPEYDLLSTERQRKFKTEILNCLNYHLDEQEKEKSSSQNYRCSSMSSNDECNNDKNRSRKVSSSSNYAKSEKDEKEICNRFEND